MTIRDRNFLQVFSKLAGAACGLGLLAAPAPAATWFVRSTAPAGGAGTSWAAAFDKLDVALAAAVAGDEIRVATGFYLPPPARTASFFVSGVTLLGGFPAMGGPLSTRNPAANVTTLSGDIGIAGDVADNCYHVVVASQCVVDGFTIESGNANGMGGNAFGGGVYATTTVSLLACKIATNLAQAGGGVYYTTNQAGNSLTLDRCVVLRNAALAGAGVGSGGGLLATSQEVGRLVIDQSSFLGNSAVANGGGVFASIEHAITNTVFSGNDALGPGGGLFASAPSIAQGEVRNCTLASNTSDYLLGAGGAFLNHVQLLNSILWGNVASLGGASLLNQQLLASVSLVEYSDTEGAVFVPGAGNISANPVFLGASGLDGIAGTQDDNLHLSGISPCLDVGDNARAATPFDRDNRARIQLSKPAGSVTVDLGAYERTYFAVAWAALSNPQLGIVPGQ